MRFIRRAVSVSLGFLCLPETDSAFAHKNLSPRQRNALPLQDEAAQNALSCDVTKGAR